MSGLGGDMGELVFFGFGFLVYLITRLTMINMKQTVFFLFDLRGLNGKIVTKRFT